MDNLEQFIKDNKEELDRYDPSKDIWKKIKRGLKKIDVSIPFRFSIAAMLAVIMGTAVVLFMTSRKKDIINNVDNNGQPVLKETEAYYNSLIYSLYHEAIPLFTSQPEIAKELTTGMSQLDSICAEIRKDLKDNIANQEVIEALIQNYRIKIQLLDEMLSLLKQNEDDQGKTKGHEL